MVDLHDLADCYVRIVEQKATGIFHAVDDTNDTLLGCALGVAQGSIIETIPIEKAREQYGPFADALNIDQTRLQHRHPQETRLVPQARVHVID